MATWVAVERAMKFPEVNKVYTKAGRGQGNTINSTQAGGSAARGFLRTVYNLLASGGTAAWLRYTPGVVKGRKGSVQVDVEAIPGVRKLRHDGKWVKYVG